jgi:hypothetical protein
VPWILKDKVHLHETRADVVERVPAAIADVVLIDGPVDKPRKQMKDRPCAHVIAHGGVCVLQEFLCEDHGALSPAHPGEGVEVTHGEVTRVRRHHVKETSLWFRVAESGNSFDLILGHFHSDKISAVNSR